MVSVNNSTTFLFSLFGLERMLETFSSECAEMYSNGLVVRAKPSHTRVCHSYQPTQNEDKDKVVDKDKYKEKSEGKDEREEEDKDDDEDEVR